MYISSPDPTSDFRVIYRVDESAFIDKIVQEIFSGIRPRGMENNLIGIKSRLDALNSLLATEATEEVLIIGICGMGGIGKTTIARALFGRIAYKFEGSSFANDVRENSSSKKDICALQGKILRDVLVTQHVTTIQDPEHGADMIRKRFRNKKVLLVLDDVDNLTQLEFLAARRKWFGLGSRIVITTRNEHLLSDANAKYKPPILLEDQALGLFSRHAFRKNIPPSGYEELSYRAIRYTGCLPLALKVLGSFFYKRQADVWESALNRLAKKQNAEIFETLKLSFDGLDDSEKEIFLDIACFFKGKDEEHVTRVLDSFGFDPVIGITILIEKSLVTISNKRLNMHDLIQDMGRQIVCSSFPNSRLWQLEQIHDFVSRNKKLKAIEAIVVPYKQHNVEKYDEELGFRANVFESMKNLRLLDIDQKFTSREPTILPYDLQWLQWNEYPFSSLPLAHMRKLVGIEMLYGRIKHLWKGQKIFPNLKFIHLQRLGWLTKFPDVSGAPNVERLVLLYCESLVEVHESLGSHRRLVYLDMSGCERLVCLPSIIEMESLETLRLSDCYRLERFPEVGACMVKLSNLYLDSCFRVEELPSSIRYLSSLSFLHLQNCKSLMNIPDSICELQQLKSLQLHNCEKLQKLPEELGSMKNLEDLGLGITGYVGALERPESINFHTFKDLCSLRKLDLSRRQIRNEDFPQDLHGFSSLEELHLSGNSKLIELPASISHLFRLKHLELNECCQLQKLHVLPSGIQVLKASDCSSLEKIEDLSEEYEWLYKIWLVGCVKLLEDQENERYLDKMLQESFLKRCAAVDHRLSIAIPGNKIPSWFEEEQHGHQITLKLPHECHIQIMGFAVCGLFQGVQMGRCSPEIIFTIVNDEKSIPKSEVDCIVASAAAENGNVWISYMPFSFFQQMYHDSEREDWSHIEGNLVTSIRLQGGEEAVRCGAHIVYKQDVELIGEPKICIPDYRNLEYSHGSGNTRVCLEMYMSPWCL
ncbi:TMV resistance protein N-like [Cynara cardunculus var. scolymus]|uniref:TMV resistance protein N-like n=1 Tax=Cynara cardunculus var. scolymus TaxID=59895 RepID=UPI000D625730|nr:TMV resistance protein N-like [Cynara cardunculus var. scolymus]